jgi:hypothetical protein
MLMSRVKVIESLTLGLAYPQVSSLQLLFHIVIVRIMFPSNCPVSICGVAWQTKLSYCMLLIK